MKAQDPLSNRACGFRAHGLPMVTRHAALRGLRVADGAAQSMEPEGVEVVAGPVRHASGTQVPPCPLDAESTQPFRRNARWPLLPIGLRDVPAQHHVRPVRPFAQRRRDLREKALDTPLLDLGERHTVNARRSLVARASCNQVRAADGRLRDAQCTLSRRRRVAVHGRPVSRRFPSNRAASACWTPLHARMERSTT